MFDLLLKHGGSGLRDFISALLQGLQFNSNSLDVLYSDLLIRSRYNGQKMVMQKALNEIFGLAVNTIYIVTGRNPNATIFFYEPAELVPTYFYEVSENNPEYFSEPGEITGSGFDFVVLIPVGIWTAELDRRVRSEVVKIKLIGKTFTTQTF